MFRIGFYRARFFCLKLSVFCLELHKPILWRVLDAFLVWLSIILFLKNVHFQPPLLNCALFELIIYLVLSGIASIWQLNWLKRDVPFLNRAQCMTPLEILHVSTFNRTRLSHFGPRVYPRGSYVITHVRPLVRLSLSISETALRIILIFLWS